MSLLLPAFSVLAVWLVSQSAAQLSDGGYPALQRPITPCSILASTFPSKVLFPGDSEFEDHQATYYAAQQAEQIPACRFLPSEARDIQEALADIIIPSRTPIAVAAGGRSSVQGLSNIDAPGIVFDLRRLGGTMPIENNTQAFLGAGATWGDVYGGLQSSNLTLPGGRAASSGVGGHLLGADFGWFAGQVGWSSDAIVEYEFVTPQAEILTVTQHNHQDLFWALKGSLGALGIVTRFVVRTIPITDVFAGLLTFDAPSLPQVFDALYTLTAAPITDTTSASLHLTWSAADLKFTAHNVYLIETTGRPSSPGLVPLQSVPHAHSSLRTQTLQQAADEYDTLHPSSNPPLRRTHFTLTLSATPQILSTLHELLITALPTASVDPSLHISTTIHPIPLALRANHTTIFAPFPSSSPLFLLSVDFTWSASAKDKLLRSAAQILRDQICAALPQQHPHRSPLNAMRDQNPFLSTGAMRPRALDLLREVRSRYDPTGVWESIVPGMWTLSEEE